MLSHQKGAFRSGGGVRLLLLDVPESLRWVFITQVNRNAAQSGFAAE